MPWNELASGASTVALQPQSFSNLGEVSQLPAAVFMEAGGCPQSWGHREDAPEVSRTSGTVRSNQLLVPRPEPERRCSEKCRSYLSLLMRVLFGLHQLHARADRPLH